MNNYTDLVEIGKGSFGTVYKASKRKHTEPFAIKKVRCNAPENVELALQEFWTLSYLQKHLNIIRFEECYLQHAGKMRSMKHGDVSSPSYLYLVEMSIKGESAMTKGRYHLWFVMEYCDGGDMNDYLLSRVPIAKLNASFMSQLADGIAFLHQNSVVHRDLKPENILVRTTSCESDGGTPFPTLKIADFGLSKVCSSKSQSQVNVDTCWLSSACGSDFFMAPEVFEGHYTAKADVFALGIMFWAIMDRITFIDATTKKVLLGTYIRRDKDVLPVGEALLDDSKLNLNELLTNTGIRKNVIFARGLEPRKASQSSTCVSANKSKLRELIAGMLNPNADMRPNSQELSNKLKAVLHLETKFKTKQVAKKSPKKSPVKLCSKVKRKPVLPCVDARSPVTIEQCRRPKRGHLHRIVCANDACSEEANNAIAADTAASVEHPTKRVTRSSSSRVAERSPTPPTAPRVLRSRKVRPSASASTMQDETCSVRHSKSPLKGSKSCGADAESSETNPSPKATTTVKSKEILRVSKKVPVECEKSARAAKSDRILRSSLTTRRKTLRAWKRREICKPAEEKTNIPRCKKNAAITVNKNAKESPVTEPKKDVKTEDINDSVSSGTTSPNPHQVAVKKRWKHLSGNKVKKEADAIPLVRPDLGTDKRRRGTVISISTTGTKPKHVYSATSKNPNISRTISKEQMMEADENFREFHRPVPTRTRPSLKQQIKESVRPPLATFPKPKATPDANRRLAAQPPKLRLKGDKRIGNPDRVSPEGQVKPKETAEKFFASPPAQSSFVSESNSAHVLKRKLSGPREESTPKRPRYDIPSKMFYSGSWQPAPWSQRSTHSCLPLNHNFSPSQTIPTYSQAFRWSLNSLSVGNSPRMSTRPSVSSSLPPSPHTGGSSGRYLASYFDGVNQPLIPQIYKSTPEPSYQRRSLDSPALPRTNPMLSPDLFVRAYARKSISHDLSPASPCPFLLQGPPTVPPVD